MKTNSIVVKDGKKFDLNGLPISLRGTTAYAGVSFMACYSFTEPMYVAIIGLNSEDQVLSGKHTFIWHLSVHDNPLDAAYSAMMFEQNRTENLTLLREVDACKWNPGFIPVFEYEPILANENKVEAMMTRETAKIFIDNRPADTNFDVLCRKYNVPALANKFGREIVLLARKVLTINEFELRFGL